MMNPDEPDFFILSHFSFGISMGIVEHQKIKLLIFRLKKMVSMDPLMMLILKEVKPGISMEN